ncbi:MAG: hypothetical protein ACJAS9_003271, partial [Polaribacter sp.]
FDVSSLEADAHYTSRFKPVNTLKWFISISFQKPLKPCQHSLSVNILPQASRAL